MTTLTEHSPALWNRARFDLRSDEILAQVLDRGGLAEWREMYALAATDADLRRRIAHIAVTVPIGYPGFWVASMAALGESVAWPERWPEERS